MPCVASFGKPMHFGMKTWSNAAFNLSESDLKMMDFIVRAQQRMSY
jgi:hypothetical protein